jgi:hypothetical protein
VEGGVQETASASRWLSSSDAQEGFLPSKCPLTSSGFSDHFCIDERPIRIYFKIEKRGNDMRMSLSLCSLEMPFLTSSLFATFPFLPFFLHSTALIQSLFHHHRSTQSLSRITLFSFLFPFVVTSVTVL